MTEPQPPVPEGLDADDYSRAAKLVQAFMLSYAGIAARLGGRPACSPKALTVAMLNSLGAGAVGAAVDHDTFVAWAQAAYSHGVRYIAFMQSQPPPEKEEPDA